MRPVLSVCLSVRIDSIGVSRPFPPGPSVSSYLVLQWRERSALLEQRHREDEHQRNVLLNRWNANLNMIAKWVNTYRDEANARHVIRQLKALERELSLVRQLWSQS